MAEPATLMAMAEDGPLLADGSRLPPVHHKVRHRPRFLLIDDEPTVARFIGHAAEDLGYAAQVTISASSFRREYEAAAPDVVAIDLAMPGGDGVELLRYLAEQKSQALIVIISGFDDRVLDSALRLGQALGLRMAGPLHKPIRVADLESAIGSRPVAALA